MIPLSDMCIVNIISYYVFLFHSFWCFYNHFFFYDYHFGWPVLEGFLSISSSQKFSPKVIVLTLMLKFAIYLELILIYGMK